MHHLGVKNVEIHIGHLCIATLCCNSICFAGFLNCCMLHADFEHCIFTIYIQ